MKNFVETNLKTKYGEFIIRVYNECQGKETVVLRTLNLKRHLPVNVRVHSECFTGDLLKSLHCDCGDQLKESLKFIYNNSGVFIYLRQEGRGIGLFEKMKAYKLQKKGYDTFEANVKLGHAPDLRTYEKVKVILDDLQIKEIKLLTNNPTKVSEIASYGINVVERISLIIKPGKNNKKYLDTKKNKFQHLLIPFEKGQYFYQFHADKKYQIEKIADFLKDKKRDPLLKICLGINANSDSLLNLMEINNIQTLYSCAELNFLTPILHFSFHNCCDIKKELKNIKSKIPQVTRIQLNDLKKDDLIKNVEHALAIYSRIDIPLDNESFNLINNSKFRKLVKKTNVFILLDNSKGKGIKEEESSLMKKINILLDYGFNNIAIAGGFGPNELSSYFKLRKYYKINFSIDAETKLKTNNKIDIEKTKLYLFQLLNSENLYQKAIEQTKDFLMKCKRSKWEMAKIENIEFKIHPLVFHAGKFPSTAWYAGIVPNLIKDEKKFCEVGCGAGVISCIVALKNPNISVVATDINPYAKKNTLLNSKRLGLNNRIKVFDGDVLDSISPNKQFDSIFWLLPFGYLNPNEKTNLEDLQVFDPGYKSLKKFFETAYYYLKPNGRLLLGFSSDLGNVELLHKLAKKCHLDINEINEKILLESRPVKFELFSCFYSK